MDRQTKLQKILGIMAGGMVVVTLVVPVFFGFNTDWIQQFGYVGLFLASYFGFGIWMLPLAVQYLHPVGVILVGAFGVTIDEFFAWYAGKSSENFEAKFPWHHKVHGFVEKYGLKATFVFGLLPLPGVLYAVSGFAAGFFGIPFYKFFLVNFSGKLIRSVVIVTTIIKVF